MRFTLLILLPLLSTLPSAADPKIFLDSNENADRKPVTVTEWYITPQELDRLPVSDPAAGPLPVSIAEAIKLARAEVDKEAPAKSTATLDTIELDQINAGDQGETVQEASIDQPTGKWYYKITYSVERPDPKTGVYTYPLPIYVLMDRTLAQRRDRPQTPEELNEEKQLGDQIKATVLKEAAKNK